jgi:hypothetical protein
MERLSKRRYNMAAASCGNKVLFAGGTVYNTESSPETSSDLLEIYDVVTKTWNLTYLLQPVSKIKIAVVGSKVIFLGTNMQIYDVVTGTIELMDFQQKRVSYEVTTWNNFMLVGGGEQSLTSVEFYQENSTTPSTDIPSFDHSKVADWPQGLDLEVPVELTWCNNNICGILHFVMSPLI